MAIPVTVSIVTYQSEAVIERCLRSIPANVAVIVVDNASSDTTCAIIRDKFPKTTLIENPQNIGFGAAHNLAVKRVETEFAFLLNPDAALEEGCLAALHKAATDFPDAAIVAPALLDEQRQLQQNSYNCAFYHRSGKGGLSFAEGEICAEFLSGAALWVRVDAFRAIGGFDERLFLFYEDDDLCLQAREAGYSCVFVPQARVFHVAGQSSPVKSWADIRHKYSHMAQSELILYKKYCGITGCATQFITRLLSCSAKTLLYTLLRKTFKAQKYRARLVGMLRFIQT